MLWIRISEPKAILSRTINEHQHSKLIQYSLKVRIDTGTQTWHSAVYILRVISNVPLVEFFKGW
jgi:hypothetical protein